MTTQITIRLPDDIADFIDQRVAEGHATSRANVVAAAMRREQRRILYEAERHLIESSGSDPELDAFADWSADHHLPLDD